VSAVGPPRVLVVGSANVDYTVALPRLPQPGETVSEGSLLIAHGGKGANQAVAARRLGAEVRFIGCVGDDLAGRGVRAALSAEGVGVDGLFVAGDAATGTALILVDREGRNQIGVAPGANRCLTADHVLARGEDFDWAEVVIAQCETPLAALARVFAEARARRARTILNPAPVPEGPLPFLGLVDVLTPNLGEAARLSGVAVASVKDAERAGQALRALGPATVVVTLGADGALAAGPEGVVHSPGFAVAAVDTTAAGDAFNAALAVALCEGRPLASALAFANAAAALACTVRGAQPSLPRRAGVERLLQGTIGPAKAGC
jgi:ribokinase